MTPRPNVETSWWDVSNDAPSTEDRQRFKGYRVESTRLRGWDYASNAFYFVTICTRERLPLLGEIVNGKMILSRAGRIANEEWLQSAEVRSDVTIDQYIVMPDHVHGIIVLQGQRFEVAAKSIETPHRGVSTARLAAGSLGAIVGQFKSVCSKRIRAAGLTDFGWQPRFYDHIIRDEKSLDNIRQYIADNPLKWQDDHDTPENLWM